MKLSNIHITILSAISVSAIAFLIYYQYKILTEQKQITERQRLNNITAFKLNVMKLSKPVHKITRELEVSISDTFSWKYSSGQALDPAHEAYEFNYIFDSLFGLHNIPESYILDGIITNSGYCQIFKMNMGRGAPKGKDSYINDYPYTMCLCHHSTSLSFDVGYSIVNSSSSLSSFKEPTIISMVLVVVIFLTFIITLTALRKQKRISELRESFVNTLSHNFETPIFSINLAVKSLRKVIPESSRNKTDKFLELISSENLRLKNYSEKILYEALIATEKPELAQEEVDIVEIIERVVESLAILADQKNVNIKTKFDISDAVIIADRTHFFNSIYNILDNAIKYSRINGEVEVRVLESKDKLSIEIQDFGVGMNASTLKNIFKKYYRGDEVKTTKGFGLGLSYVKRIMDLHQYTIHIDSELNHGTTVKIDINK